MFSVQIFWKLHILFDQYQEQPDIEKEVKRLFRMDNEAIDVRWEVVECDNEAGLHNDSNQDLTMLGWYS